MSENSTSAAASLPTRSGPPWANPADLIPSMVAYWDKDLICRFANRAYQVWFGKDPQDLLGRPIQELLGPKLFQLNEPYMRAALNGQTQTFERVVPGPDGVARHSLARYLPDYADGKVVGFVAYVTEVTELKQAQADLEASLFSLRAEVQRRRSAEDAVSELQAELSATLDSIGAGFIATDRSGHVTRINRAAEQLFEYSAGEAIGKSMWDVFRREGRPAEIEARNPVDVALESGTTADVTHDVIAISKSGRRFPLQVSTALTRDSNAEVRGMAVIIRDQTQLRRAENERLRAEEQLRHVVSAAPNALIMVDLDGIVSFANVTVERLLRFRPDELIGRPLTLLAPAHDPGARAAIETLLARANAENQIEPGEYYLYRRDGSPLAVEIRLSPIRNDQGSFCLLTITDITERKKITDELRRSNADLEQFAYVASHDLQEPLRMVASFTELLAKRYSGRLDPKADEYMAHAVSGARRMQKLVLDLLEYSRVGSSRRELVATDPRAILERVLEMMARRLEESGAKVRVGELPRVMADESQLTQVFQNLIGNALKFRSDAPPLVEVSASSDAGLVRFSVSDNGIGIDPQYCDQIFAMFQRIHARGKFEGSGIGLAITKRIIEGFGQKVWVESSPGKGATFHFTLMPAPIDVGST